MVECTGLENRRGSKAHRGFESHLLRHCPVRNVSLSALRPDFPVFFKGYAGGLFTSTRAKRTKCVSPGRFSLNLMTEVIW